MKKLLLILSVFALIFLGAISALATPVWSDPISYDSVSIKSGGSFELLPDTPICYNVRWVPGFNRTISLFLKEKSASISGWSLFGAGDTSYTFLEKTEGDSEDEGTITWDYTKVSPSALPRNSSYDLCYSITGAGGSTYTPAGGATATCTINITPEPGIFSALILLGAVALLKR